MVFHLSLLLVFHIYSVILMSFNFLGCVFTSIIALLGLVFPSLVIARSRAAVSSTSISVKRESIQPMELDWILAICISLLGQKPATSKDVRFKLFPTSLSWPFTPVVNVSPLWCSLTILKTTWLLATIGYISARGVGKASAGIVSHVSRQLIKHMWCLGLNQIQTLRLDMLNRLEGARFATQDRVTSQHFFGLRLGQIMSFDPCLSHCPRLWTLGLIYRLFDPDRQGSPYSDNLMGVRERDANNPTSCSEKFTGFADSLQGLGLGRTNSHKENLVTTTISLLPGRGSTTHPQRPTHDTLNSSILEARIHVFFICLTNNGSSAAKPRGACGETERSFRDYLFDRTQRLCTILLHVPGLNARDNDIHETMKSMASMSGSLFG